MRDTEHGRENSRGWNLLRGAQRAFRDSGSVRVIHLKVQLTPRLAVDRDHWERAADTVFIVGHLVAARQSKRYLQIDENGCQ